MKYYYGPDWRALRLAKITATPFCEECERFGIKTIASLVHHIVPLKQQPEKRLDIDNLMCVCHRCHYFLHLDCYKHPSKRNRFECDLIAAE